ncbi:MAG: alpha-amylase family glycosyl hydrolase, partial [Planctomycetota bacterium]
MIASWLAAALVALAPAASADDNVEWNGATHVAWQDRRPLCPVGGEAFDVLFQTYRFDITSARVRMDDGAVTWVDAAFDHDRGPYAVWRAALPATASSTLSYYIELTDGTDTDYLSVGGMSDGLPVDGGFVVDYGTLAHAPVGATPVTGGGTVFKVWAPTPTSAYVRGQFNSWGLGDPMTGVGDYYTAHVPNAAYRQMYKYYFQPGAVWKPDARARSLNPGDNYNSHIEDPFNYVWGDAGFETPPFEEMIIYELHVGTFAGRNDPAASGSIPATYADVAVHVDHLVELGVNVVELTPVTEFPWDFSAGYNPVSCWAAEWKYGDPDDLKAMIDVLHQNGIAVLLDIVWNHFSPTDNYLWYYDGGQVYFDNPAVDTPWGSQADFDRLDVRDYFANSALYWLEEFHFDGYRMDATDFMNMYQGSGWGLMQRFNDEIDARWVDKIAIAEQLPDDSWVTRPTNLGGAGFDSQWYDAFVDNLRQEIFDAALGNPEMWRISNIINGGGTYLSNTNVANYLELHDEAWP